MSLHLPLRQACGGVIGVIPELQGRIRDRRQNELLKSSPEKGEDRSRLTCCTIPDRLRRPG